jgi:hypothetical protein
MKAILSRFQPILEAFFIIPDCVTYFVETETMPFLSNVDAPYKHRFLAVQLVKRIVIERLRLFCF